MKEAGPAVVWVHPDAPAKPAVGAPCNGCGLCCLSEPCPVGIVISRRRRGRCQALRWDARQQRYRCGLLRDAGDETPTALTRWVQAALRRWIAAGVGCDADLQPLPLSSFPPAVDGKAADVRRQAATRTECHGLPTAPPDTSRAGAPDA